MPADASAVAAPSTEGEHAPLAPSGGFTWVNCTGSIALCRSIPPEDRIDCDEEESELGTAAHEFGALGIIKGRQPLGTVASNGYIYDAEMEEAVNTYLDDIDSIRADCYHSPKAHDHIEERVNCDRIHTDCWGTPDYWAYNPETQTVYLRDYKNGRKFVEVFECWQLILYAAGVAREIGSFPGLRFNLGVIQPRAFHPEGPVRIWQPTQVELAKLWDKAARSAQMAFSDDPICKPGPWCYKCPGRLRCEAFIQDLGAVQNYIGSANPIGMTPAQTAIELVLARRAEKMLKYHLDALETEVANYSMRGESMPAVCVERGKGREVWKCSDAQAIALGKLHGVDIAKPTKAITPLQARSKGVDEEAMRLLTHTPSTGLTITEASNSQASLTFARNPVQ